MSTPKTETNEDTVSNRKRVHNFLSAGRTATSTKATKTSVNQCTVVGEAKRKPTTPITSFFAKVAAITNSPAEASPTESVSPWRSRLGDASVTNRALCLHTAAMRAEVTNFTPQQQPMSRYLLALVYLPGSSVTNEDHYDNATSHLVMEPILGRNYFTVEFVGLFIPVNAWVNLRQVKLECNNADSWMVRDYMDRVSHIIDYKEKHGLPVDLFVGGPDAKAALRPILHGFTRVGSLSVFVHTKPLGNFITITSRLRNTTPATALCQESDMFR